MKYLAKRMSEAKSSIDRSRPATLDSVTSVGGGGRYANVKTYDDAELRDLRIVLPYGISSSALDNMRVQVILNNDNGDASIVGVHDIDRPAVANGEIIFYNSSGDMIKLTHSGIDIVSSKPVTVNGKRIAVQGDQVEVTVGGTKYTGTIK